MRIPRLFFDLDGLDAKTLRVIGSSGSVRAVGVFKALNAQSVSVSYPGLVNRLKRLCSQGILSKHGLRYSVNETWLSEMQAFFGVLHLRFRQ